MGQEDVASLVRKVLARYKYEILQGTVGVAWPADKVNTYVEQLKQSLVDPYLMRFELRETLEQSNNPAPTFAEYWVVAESGDYLEWFDPTTGEFGLAVRSQQEGLGISIGTRGDLVGVFCAM